MDQHRASPRPPFDDVDLDDTPGLTAGDRAALDAIRRQLAEEYPGGDAAPSLSIEPGITASAARARPGRPWRPPVVAALVTLAAVGGSVVGAIVTVYILRDPVTVTRTGTDEVAPTPPDVNGTMPAVPVGPTARVTPEARADRARSPVLRSPRPPSAAPVPSAPPPSSPSTQEVAASISGAAASAGPEPQDWSDPFRPLSAETAAHAGVAKAAFNSATPSRVPLPDPPPSAPPLPAPAAVAPPRVAWPRPLPASPSAADSPASPASARDEGLRTSIREDWNTVKSGFASAPEDFKRAWGAFTRDLKGLLDR